MKTKNCPKCVTNLPLSQFAVRKSGKRVGMISSYCKKCSQGYNRNSIKRKWTRLRGNIKRKDDSPCPSSPELSSQLGEPTNCYLCGEEISWATAELDHIVPRSRGGTNDIENLAWASRLCNRMKHNQTVDELMARCQAVMIFSKG